MLYKGKSHLVAEVYPRASASRGISYYRIIPIARSATLGIWRPESTLISKAAYDFQVALKALLD